MQLMLEQHVKDMRVRDYHVLRTLSRDDLGSISFCIHNDVALLPEDRAIVVDTQDFLRVVYAITAEELLELLHMVGTVDDGTDKLFAQFGAVRAYVQDKMRE